MNNDQILQKLGISQLAPMQQEAYRIITETTAHVVVLSPTGTGKTLAYLLPIAQMIDADNKQLQAIVVVPGRELALQSQQVMQKMQTNVKSMALYGGRPTMDEHREIKQIQPQIVFATPGRLNDHIDKDNLKPQTVRWLIIDEFDKCLEMGFQAEMTKLVKSMPRPTRRILLSATNASEIPQFVNLKAATQLNYLDDNASLRQRINIYKVYSPEKDKLNTLRSLLLSVGSGQTIVFLNYRDSVERTAAYLAQNGFSISLFHGGLDQRGREAALYRFANGSAQILVTTDLASRGLDIPDVENIIHYHIPETQENYTHRTGRTARWNKQGRAFFILSEGEHLPEYVDCTVDEYTPQPSVDAKPPLPRMTTLYLGKGKKDKISKADIVGFLCKKAMLQKEDIGKIDVKDYYCYVAVSRQKAQQVIQKAKGEKIKGIRTIWEEVKR